LTAALGRIPRRVLLALLPTGAAVWLCALVLAPWAVTHGPVRDQVTRLAATVYVAGSLVCHQQPSRSFHLWGARLPVCARCCGLYLGAFGGLLIALLSRRPSHPRNGLDEEMLRRRRWLIAGAAAPTAIIWLLEHAGILPAITTNWTRALSGLPLGGAVAWVVWTSLRWWSGPET
jgi:Predicted membrane protein (DUF2085)